MYPEYHSLDAADVIEHIMDKAGISGENVNKHVNYAPGFRSYVPPKEGAVSCEPDPDKIARGVKILRELLYQWKWLETEQ